MAYGQDKVFAAVRNNGSGPFIDLSSVSGSRERVMEVVRHHEETIPGWCKANPLIRVERFQFVTMAD